MDVLSPLTYRSVAFNTSDSTPSDIIGGGIDGIIVQRFDYSDVSLSQFMEQKALTSGMDAGDAFEGRRVVSIGGSLFATTRALMYDKLRVLRRTMSAAHAFAQDSVNKGFLPLDFSVPTDDSVNYPDRTIAQRIYVIPVKLSAKIIRNNIGGKDGDALAYSWDAQLLARDPRIYAQAAIVKGVANQEYLNRGDYAAPIFVDMTVGAVAGTVSIAFGANSLVITVPGGAVGRRFLYDGHEKTLRVDGVLDRSLLAVTTHPTVPVGTITPTVVVTTAQIMTGTIYFTEQYA